MEVSSVLINRRQQNVRLQLLQAPAAGLRLDQAITGWDPEALVDDQIYPEAPLQPTGNQKDIPL